MLPTTITILNHTYTIAEVDPGLWNREGIGRSNVLSGQIELRRDSTEDLKRTTLLHEFVHQVGEILDLPPLRDDEHVVSVLAIAFYQFLMQDPDIVEWITKRQFE